MTDTSVLAASCTCALSFPAVLALAVNGLRPNLVLRVEGRHEAFPLFVHGEVVHLSELLGLALRRARVFCCWCPAAMGLLALNPIDIARDRSLVDVISLLSLPHHKKAEGGKKTDLVPITTDEQGSKDGIHRYVLQVGDPSNLHQLYFIPTSTPHHSWPHLAWSRQFCCPQKHPSLQLVSTQGTVFVIAVAATVVVFVVQVFDGLTLQVKEVKLDADGHVVPFLSDWARVLNHVQSVADLPLKPVNIPLALSATRTRSIAHRQGCRQRPGDWRKQARVAAGARSNERPRPRKSVTEKKISAEGCCGERRNKRVVAFGFNSPWRRQEMVCLLLGK